MPLLAWRTDADGFNFSNDFVFDSTEQQVLAGLGASVAPVAAAAVLGMIAPVIAANPFLVPVFAPLVPVLPVVASAAAYSIIGSNLNILGLCGGMAYTSLDYWYAKQALPCGGDFNDRPMRTNAVQSAVRNTLWRRLIDSLISGGALEKTIEWSLLLNQVPPQLGGGPKALLSLTAKEWPKIKASIDAGQPCPIGLVYNSRQIWEQHQILVYGYDLHSNGARLYVYDSYFPHEFGETGFNPAKDFLTFDISGPILRASSPSDNNTPLAGFFRTNYAQAAPPSGLATSFGKFITWDGVTNWETAYGAILKIANAAELTALGGTSTDHRTAKAPMPTRITHPRDNALLREHSSAPVFLYQGGAPFHVPNPAQLMNFGGWSAVRVVPDNTLAQFMGAPAN